MANLTAIDYHSHKHLRINPEAAELHGAELNMIPVVVDEFTNLAVQYPIVIAKNEETGQFSLSALLGFEQHENLYWYNLGMLASCLFIMTDGLVLTEIQGERIRFDDVKSQPIIDINYVKSGGKQKSWKVKKPIGIPVVSVPAMPVV